MSSDEEGKLFKDEALFMDADDDEFAFNIGESTSSAVGNTLPKEEVKDWNMDDIEAPLFEEEDFQFSEEKQQEPVKQPPVTLGTLKPPTTLEEAEEQPKFKVNVSVARRKKVIDDEEIKPSEVVQTETSKKGKPVQRQRIEETMTASGPFAMGPSNATSRAAPIDRDPLAGVARPRIVSSGPKDNGSREQTPVSVKSEDKRDPSIAPIYSVESEEEAEDYDDFTEGEPIFMPLKLGKNPIALKKEEDALQDRTKLHLFQLPTALPRLIRKDQMSRDTTPSHELSMSRSSSAPVNEKNIPFNGLEGRIGKLVMYKDGAMKLRIGKSIAYDMTQAPLAEYPQTVTCINSDDQKMYFIGNVATKYVCTPDIEALLKMDG